RPAGAGCSPLRPARFDARALSINHDARGGHTTNARPRTSANGALVSCRTEDRSICHGGCGSETGSQRARLAGLNQLSARCGGRARAPDDTVAASRAGLRSSRYMPFHVEVNDIKNRRARIRIERHPDFTVPIWKALTVGRFRVPIGLCEEDQDGVMLLYDDSVRYVAINYGRVNHGLLRYLSEAEALQINDARTP